MSFDFGRADAKGRNVYLVVSIDNFVSTFKVKRESAPELNGFDGARTTIRFKPEKDMLGRNGEDASARI